MQKIDSHQHFWNFDPIRDSWITEDMSVIQQDFYPKDLQPLLYENGFDGCVAVQAVQSEAENEFLLQLADENDIIKGIVGWVDLQAQNVEERLEYYSGYSKLKGFRHVLQGEAQRDLILQPEFMKGISHLSKYNFTYDVLIYEDQLKYIPEFVAAFPNQRFVVDHLAKPNIKEKKIDNWKRDIQAVAQYENIFCKLSGMVTEANWNDWKQADFIPYIDAVVEGFGINRIMFGSDWPVCQVAASYGEVVGIVQKYFTNYSDDEQEKVFATNAISFYQL